MAVYPVKDKRRQLEIGDIVDCDKGRCEIVDKTRIYFLVKDASGDGWMREAAVAFIREHRPQARIIHEINAVNMLWHAELLDVAHRLALDFAKRTTIAEMVRALLWNCTGKQLTRELCSALRRRECIEADPPIEVSEVA